MKHRAGQLCMILTLLSFPLCSEPAAKLRLCRSNGRYLEDQAGNPLFLVGYHAHNIDLESSIGYPKLLELNARNRINYVRYFPCCAGVDEPSFHSKWIMFKRVPDGKVDLGQWDEGYWSRMREHLTFMRDHGIVAHISLFEGCLPWNKHPFNAKFNINSDMGNVDRDRDGDGHEQGEFFDAAALIDPKASPRQKALKFYQERIVSRILSESAGYPNVIYEIGNELPNPGREWIAYWVRFIRERCDNCVTYNGNEGLTQPGFDGATAHVHRESSVRRPFSMEEMSRGRFVASSSDGGEITYIGSTGARRSLWKAFTGGIGGWLNYSSDFYAHMDAEAYYYSPESPGDYNLRKGLFYLNAVGFIHDWGLPFPEMSPQDSVILQKPAGIEAYCFAGKGEYVLYLWKPRLGGELSLDLKPAEEHAYWFNPRTGAFFQRITVKQGTNAIPIPTMEQDLVLYIGRPRTEISDLQISDANSPLPTVRLSVRNAGEKLKKDSIRVEYSNDGLASFHPWSGVSVEDAGDGDRLSIEIAKLPFGKASAATNWLSVEIAAASGRRAKSTIPIVGSAKAWIDLGQGIVADGLRHIQNSDGRTIAAVEAGRPCRRNADPSQRVPDRYMYFSVDDAFAYAGRPQNFTLTVTYLDAGDGEIELHYDSQGEGIENAYRSGGRIPLTGTREWKEHTFVLPDAYFAGRQNAEADFRFFFGEENVGFISRVELAITSRPSPPQ